MSNNTIIDLSHEGFHAVGDALGALDLRIQALEAARKKLSGTASYSANCACALRIIVENYLEDSTMSITPEPFETMPLSNTLVPEREDVLMTQARTEHVITGNFSKRRVVSAFVLAAHSMSVWGKVRLELFSDYDQGGTVNYDSGFVLARKRIPIQQLRVGIDSWGAMYGDDLTVNTPLWFDSVFAKSFRITLYDREATGSPDYFSVGNMILGRYWAPETKNFDWGSSIQWVDNVVHTRSEGKTQHAEGTADKYRRSEFSLNNLSENDATLFYEFIRKVGGLKEFFISGYPESTQTIRQIEHGFIGRFTEGLPIRTEASAGKYQTPVIIEEV